jgi:hypothetical protein
MTDAHIRSEYIARKSRLSKLMSVSESKIVDLTAHVDKKQKLLDKKDLIADKSEEGIIDVITFINEDDEKQKFMANALILNHIITYRNIYSLDKSGIFKIPVKYFKILPIIISIYEKNIIKIKTAEELIVLIEFQYQNMVFRDYYSEFVAINDFPMVNIITHFINNKNFNVLQEFVTIANFKDLYLKDICDKLFKHIIDKSVNYEYYHTIICNDVKTKIRLSEEKEKIALAEMVRFGVYNCGIDVKSDYKTVFKFTKDVLMQFPVEYMSYILSKINF